MPRVADYHVLQDSKITLTHGGDPWRKEWTPPSDTNLEARTVLAFVADPSSHADLTLEIEVNGSVVRSPHFVGGVQRGMWEVLSAANLEEGDNEFRFTVTEGEGSLKIGDVVLWYKRIAE